MLGEQSQVELRWCCSCCFPLFLAIFVSTGLLCFFLGLNEHLEVLTLAKYCSVDTSQASWSMSWSDFLIWDLTFWWQYSKCKMEKVWSMDWAVQGQGLLFSKQSLCPWFAREMICVTIPIPSLLIFGSCPRLYTQLKVLQSFLRWFLPLASTAECWSFLCRH